MKSLELDDVTTKVRDKTLLRNISFSVESGEVTALVGHNGAGKSTLMKTIMAVMEKYAGRITAREVYDQDQELLSFKEQLVYLPEEPMLLPELTVMQHFQLYGISYRIEEDVFQQKVEAYTKAFALTHKMGAYPDELSKGMKQKVQTICVLLPDVPLMLVDEPFMGLDIYAIDYLLTELEQKQKAGISILLTTHQLEHVRNLADSYVLLQDGEVSAAGPIEEFRSITRSSEDE